MELDQDVGIRWSSAPGSAGYCLVLPEKVGNNKVMRVSGWGRDLEMLQLTGDSFPSLDAYVVFPYYSVTDIKTGHR